MKRIIYSAVVSVFIFGAGIVHEALAHNLDTRATSINYDRSFLALMSQRAGTNGALVVTNDTFWLLIKNTAGPGTTLGAGGYQTFYVPPGARVLNAAYVYPDENDSRGFVEIPIKGAAPIATGAGSIAPSATPNLIGYTLPGLNGLGFKTNPVTAGGAALGTLAGVYADTGIFYSTNENTRMNSYGFATNAAMNNNSGDTVGEQFAANIANSTTLGILGYMTEWDSWQLRAYGRKDIAPIIDAADGRGNAPWGLASAVAGPQSGYAWQFNFNVFNSTVGTTSQKMQAAISIGPWNRIQYPGSQIASDVPGSTSVALGYAGVDASSLGLPPASLSTITNITAIRYAIGGLELGRPEYVAVQLRLDQLPDNFNCYRIYADAFGGDAAGADTGKDHLWRYFDPTLVSMNPCVVLQKDVSKPLVAPNEVFYYTITFINNGSFALTNVSIVDALPAGITHVSSIPAPSISASPNFTWNLGTVPPQSVNVITQYVRATGIGTLFNTVRANSGTNQIGLAQQSVEVGTKALLTKEKSVTPSSASPGGTVRYTLTIENIGTGINGTPMTIRETLPTGFTFLSFVGATLNGGSITSPVITVSATNASRPTFTISQGIQTGRQLVITFDALISESIEPGTYYNQYEVDYEGKRLPPVPEAPVTVAGGKIGDFVYYDWDGDGLQDAGELGITGVTMRLFNSTSNSLLRSTTTDVSGAYFFTGLSASNFYVVSVNTSTVPSGFVLTADPDSVTNALHNVNLTNNQQYLTADFGYQPRGAATIGDQVFSDVNNDGTFNGSDAGISNVIVTLYVDSNGDGVYSAGVDAFIRQTNTSASGTYTFSNLNTNFTYFVKITDGAGSAVDNFFTNPYGATTSTEFKVTPAMLSAAGGNYLLADFGYFGQIPGTITGTVFIDGNDNNTYQTNETVLPSVQVCLFVDVNSNGVIDGAEESYKCVDTDSSGFYSFTNVPPGSYVVKVIDTDPNVPSGYSPTIRTIPVTGLQSGQTSSGNDFPFNRLLDKSVDKEIAQPGDTINFTINPRYLGCDPVTGLRVIDPLSLQGLLVTSNNIGQGGTIGPYQPASPIVGEEIITGSTITTSFTADADAYIRGGTGSTSNFGSATNLFVQEGFTTNSRALFRFPLTNILTHYSVNSATMILHAATATTTTNNIRAFRISSNWLQNTVTYSNSGVAAWSGGNWVDASGAAQSTNTPYADTNVVAAGFYSWDLTDMASEWASGSASNYGVILIGQTNLKAFSSREVTAATNRPSLALNYTILYPVSNVVSVSTNTVAVGDTITVSMKLFTAVGLTNLYPSKLDYVGPGASISNPVPAGPFTIAGGSSTTVTYSVTLTAQGVHRFSANATNETYAIPVGISDTIGSMPGGVGQVITWNLGTSSPAVNGEVISSGYPAGLYAFQGGNSNNFSFHTLEGSSAGTWSSRATNLSPVLEGGTLASDGSNFVYASAGGVAGTGSTNFMRYSIISNAWTRLQGPSHAMAGGGGIVLSESNGVRTIFGLQGDNTDTYSRYNISAGTWTLLAAAAPANIGNKFHGGIAANNNFIFAFRGNSATNMYRYSTQTNVWSEVNGIPNGNTLVSNGMPVATINNDMYLAFPGGRTNFYRYNITNNTWIQLAGRPPGTSGAGAAMATDGTNIFAFTGGGTTNFYRYSIASNSWTSLAAPNFGSVTQGGALAYMPGQPLQGYFGSMSACPSIAVSGMVVTVTMTLTSTESLTNVTPGTMRISGTNASATATLLSGPLPASTNIAANGTNVFTWTYSINPGTNIGSFVFSANASGFRAGILTNFATNIANSVITVPPLTFSALVTNASGVSLIQNQAFLYDESGVFPYSGSPVTQTALGSSIGDTVWIDLDGDGVQDGNEPGLEGVEVCATAGTNTVCATTDASGKYLISGLFSNNWTVSVNTSNFPANYVPTTPITYSVPLTNGQSYLLADFGVRPANGSGQIGDYLWFDLNGDGVQDATESPISNATVYLEKLVSTNWILQATQVTAGDGLYNFTNLFSGTYRVRVDTNSVITSPYGGRTNALGLVTTPTYDLDGIASPHITTNISLLTDTSIVSNVDFGYRWCSEILGTVFWDNNNNGVYNPPGDGSATNARVQLFVDADEDGQLNVLAGDYIIDEVSSDAGGAYTFTNVPPAQYIVQVYIDSLTTGGVRDIVPTGEDYIVVDFNSCNTSSSNNFGYLQGARVEGTVFWDEDHNGIRDPDEVGLTNIIVTLSGVDKFGNGITQTVNTASSGEYKFIVPEGSYTITYNYTDLITKYPELTDKTTPSSVDVYATPGEDGVKVIDFGVDNNGKIGDTIFGDTDGDGIEDPSDPGLENVTVVLYKDYDGDGVIDPEDTFEQSDVTDETGFYQFVGLPDTTGTVKYLVQVFTGAIPEQYQKIPSAFPVGANTNLSTFSTTLTNAQTISTVDFGYPLTPGTYYSISGTIYLDNGAGGGIITNGTLDGAESGFTNVTVTVEIDEDGDGTNDIEYVLQTDSNGFYSVSGIASGANVRITVNQSTLNNPALVQTGDPDGGTLSNVFNITGISSDQNNLNFGYYPQYGSISGRVVFGDGDGLAQTNETGVTGATVTLLWGGPDGILGTEDDETFTIVTDTNGFYEFNATTITNGALTDGLLPGVYQITKTNPDGTMVSIADADDGNPDIISLNLTIGQNKTNQDFEVVYPVVIGDYVWFDFNGDGIQRNYLLETNRFMSNMTVRLYTASSNLVATTTTDSTGHYLFTGTNLLPGTYFVQLDLSYLNPTGNLKVTLANQGTNDLEDSDGQFGSISNGFVNTAPYVFPPAPQIQTNLSIDFGIAYIVIKTRASVADVSGVWEDNAGKIVWSTDFESGTAGFRVYRVDGKSGTETLLTPDIVPAGFEALGSTYEVVDPAAVRGGTGTYRLEEVEIAGTVIDLGAHEVTFRPVDKRAKAERLAARAARLAPMAAPLNVASTAVSDCLKVSFRDEGIYSVSLAAIAEGMGVTVSNLPALTLTSGGREIAYLLDEANARIVFFGEKINNAYARDNVVMIAAGIPALIASRDETAASGASAFNYTKRFEQDVNYLDNVATALPDYFVWGYGLSSAITNYSISLEGYAGGAVELKVRLIGAFPSSATFVQQATISVNGTNNVVGTINITGQTAGEAVLTVNPSLVVAGANTVNINVSNASNVYSYVAVDWIEASYVRSVTPATNASLLIGGTSGSLNVAGFTSPLVLDVTDPALPVAVTNTSGAFQLNDTSRYVLIESASIPALAPVAATCDAWFTSAANEIDYLIVVSRAMTNAVKELADYRASQGLRVGTAVFEDIVDVMFDGVRSPEAIRELIRYASANWMEAPWVILLAGNGHNDFLNVLNREVNPLPPMMYRSSVGAASSADGLLTDLDGNNLPNISVGRLPALDEAQLSAMIAKIKAHESAFDEPWQKNIAISSDARETDANFQLDNQSFAQTAQGIMNVTSLSLDSNTTATMRSQLISQFNAGAGIIHFTGHGNPTVIGRNGQNILTATHVNSLTNARRTVFVSLSCMVGRFEVPAQQSLGELFMRRPNGGAVAVWAPSSDSVHFEAMKIGRAFYRALLQDGTDTIGLALQRTAELVAGDPDAAEILITYNLLGDPALKLGGIPSIRRVGHSFAHWRWQSFKPAELANPVVSSSSSVDPVSGENNFYLYALGGKPGQGVSLDSEGLLRLTLDGSVHFEYKRRRAASDIDYRLRISEDLRVWEENPADITELSAESDPDGVMEKVRTKVNRPDAPRLFIGRKLIEK